MTAQTPTPIYQHRFTLENEISNRNSGALINKCKLVAL